MKAIVKISEASLMMILLAAALTGCNLPSAAPSQAIDPALVGTIAAQTLEAVLSQTAIPLPSSTPTPPATLTKTPTITATYSVPMVQFDGNTNCRKGPGTEYEVVTVLNAGKKVETVGISEKGNYWLIKLSDGKEPCWAANDFAKASGSISALPTVTAPPTPTPRPPNAPVWSTYTYTCDFASGGNNITMNLAWTDRADNEEGYIVYRDGQAVITLAPNANSYVDVAFVATGQEVSYAVEVFNKTSHASSSTIKASCQ